MAGRPRKPVETKRKEGTLRSRDTAQTPLVIGGRGRPTPVLCITEGQVERFSAIVDELDAGGILDVADRGMIELTAIAEASVIACNMDIFDVGITIESDGKIIRNPSCIERDRRLEELRHLYVQLGIGPSSRAALAAKGFKSSKEIARKAIPGLDEVAKKREEMKARA